MQSGNPIGGAIAGLLLPLLGCRAMIALSAIVVGVPGIIGYRVKELRLAGGREAASIDLAAGVGQESILEGERL